MNGHHLETLKLLLMNEMYEDGVLTIPSLSHSCDVGLWYLNVPDVLSDLETCDYKSLRRLHTRAGRCTHDLNMSKKCVSVQALLELEMNSDLKAQLRELNITAAKVGDLLFILLNV